MLELGITIHQEIKTRQNMLAEIEQKLVPTAARIREGSKTAHLELDDVKVLKATWSTSYKVHSDLAEKLKAILGDDWDKFFSEKTVINRARSFPQAMNDAHVRHADAVPSIEASFDTLTDETPSFSWMPSEDS